MLDEPTIGLHPRDNRRLLGALRKAARPGQHAACGRARSRSGGQRPISCSTSAPAPANSAAQIVARGTPAASRQSSGLGHRAVSERARRRSRCRRTGGCVRVDEAGKRAAGMPEDESAKQRRDAARRSGTPTAAGVRTGSKSSARGTTICAMSTCEFRWARSPPSPASAAAARAR